MTENGGGRKILQRFKSFKVEKKKSSPSTNYDDITDQYAKKYPEFDFKKWKDSFVQFDIDESGDLDIMELKRLMEKNGQPVTHVELKHVLNRFGKKSGVELKLGFKDFLEVMIYTETKSDVVPLKKHDETSSPTISPITPRPKLQHKASSSSNLVSNLNHEEESKKKILSSENSPVNDRKSIGPIPQIVQTVQPVQTSSPSPIKNSMSVEQYKKLQIEKYNQQNEENKKMLEEKKKKFKNYR